MSESLQKEKNHRIHKPNYTQVPNCIFDYWMQILSHVDFKILLHVCRKTFGWHKTEDKISISQISRETGISKSSVILGLQRLIDFELIIKIKSKDEFDGSDAPNCYEIHIHEDIEKTQGSLLKTHPPVFSEDTPIDDSLVGGGVFPEDTQKKDSLLKEKKKDIAPKGGYISFGSHFKISQEDYDSLVKQHTKQLTGSIIDDINNYCASSGKPYKCYLAAFNTFLKKQSSQPSNDGRAVTVDKMSQIRDKFKHGEQYKGIFFYNDHEKITIESGVTQKIIYFREKDFLQRFEEILIYYKLYEYWKA